MARNMKTQYVTLRVVFDQPVSHRDAFKHMKNALDGHSHAVHAYGQEGAPTSFKVVACISKPRRAGEA